MMKQPIDKNVLRLGVSPYLDNNFIQLEKQTLESIPTIKYLELNSKHPAEIIISNTHQHFENRESFNLKNTELIIHPNSGYDNFSTQLVESFPGIIIIGNEIRQHAVANYILNAIFQNYTHYESQSTWNKERKWNRKLLKDLNIQLIGNGHIGNILFRTLSPIVKNVFIYDPYQNQFDLKLEMIDVLIPVCSLNQNNVNFINQSFFNLLKEDVLIINAARGELLDLNALKDFLQNRPQAMAVLDVFSPEPYPLEQLQFLDNLITTSHIAGVYRDIDKMTIDFERKIISDYLNLSKIQFTEKYKTAILKNRLINNILI